jgi:four helix bundle protein
MEGIASHKDLVVWKRSVELASRVYGATVSLPSEEGDGLKRELRRSAVSIPSHIAEGSARRSRTEFVQFLHMARGSLSELETRLLIAQKQALVADCGSLLEEITHMGQLLNGLLRSLAERRAPPSAFPAQASPPTANR